jgi:uncharacterized protein YceH (UPF0502 family)
VEPLNEVEARVVACLVEKERTVPDTYPLSLNGLVLACNQTSNRDPVLSVTEGEVLAAIDSLKARKLARVVHPVSGRGVTKYRHVLDEGLGLDAGEVAVLAVLALRGAQTAAELRARTERLHDFGSQAEVDAALDRLASLDLARRLERRPGEREARWIHLLHPSGHVDVRIPDATVTRTEERASLEARVAKLEEEVALLRQALLE